MQKLIDIFIKGWIVFAKYLYFAFIFSILQFLAGFLPLLVLILAKANHPFWGVLFLLYFILVTPFACCFTFRITKLLGPAVSFPILCPKCGSFIERKDAKEE